MELTPHYRVGGCSALLFAALAAGRGLGRYLGMPPPPPPPLLFATPPQGVAVVLSRFTLSLHAGTPCHLVHAFRVVRLVALWFRAAWPLCVAACSLLHCLPSSFANPALPPPSFSPLRALQAITLLCRPLLRVLLGVGLEAPLSVEGVAVRAPTSYVTHYALCTLWNTLFFLHESASILQVGQVTLWSRP